MESELFVSWYVTGTVVSLSKYWYHHADEGYHTRLYQVCYVSLHKSQILHRREIFELDSTCTGNYIIIVTLGVIFFNKKS